MPAAERRLALGLLVLVATAALMVWVATTELHERRTTPPQPPITVVLGY